MSDKRLLLMGLYQGLLARFGPQFWWPAQTPLEVCVGAILVQNTNWKNVERVIANLYKHQVLSFEALSVMPVATLAELIRSSGFYNVKARRLKSFMAYVQSCYGGHIEAAAGKPWRDVRKEILGVPGIGPETADSILLYALQQPVFVVDAYTKRWLIQEGLGGFTASYTSMQSLFMDHLPSDVVLFNEYHALIVAAGKESVIMNKKGGACE